MFLHTNNLEGEAIKVETYTFTIPNISCGHCVVTIKNELGEIEGVSSIDGDPESRTVTVQWESPATKDQIESTLNEINYPAES